ncbi:MAG TPA: acyltransferase [Methylotenera sp.]|nr:acyltransferase [Methylotenera sp.]
MPVVIKDVPQRFPVIDGFKAIASQFIVWHHLAAYGPISDAVQQAAPDLIAWLYDYARMAVQVFFVIGGYLAARAMFPKSLHTQTTDNKVLTHHLGAMILNRYLRLAVPFIVAVIFSIICAIIARQWVVDDFVPDAPTWPQLLAHLLMLQSVFDFDSLTAGAWFIAIDFQLFLLMLAIVWLGGKTVYTKSTVLLLTTLMASASLLWFNRDPALDDWAPYFFGAYGMGAAAYWSGQQQEGYSKHWLWLIILLTIAALIIQFRARIMIALIVTLTLNFTINIQHGIPTGLQSLLRVLGKISYALFLVHFPILMLANAAFERLDLSRAYAGGIFMLASWTLSLLAAGIFYRHIEKPTMRLFKVKHVTVHA